MKVQCYLNIFILIVVDGMILLVYLFIHLFRIGNTVLLNLFIQQTFLFEWICSINVDFVIHST